MGNAALHVCNSKGNDTHKAITLAVANIPGRILSLIMNFLLGC